MAKWFTLGELILTLHQHFLVTLNRMGNILGSLKILDASALQSPKRMLNDVFICSWIVLLHEELINGFAWIVENTIVPVPSLVFRSRRQNLNVITNIKQSKQENLIWEFLVSPACKSAFQSEKKMDIEMSPFNINNTQQSRLLQLLRI